MFPWISRKEHSKAQSFRHYKWVSVNPWNLPVSRKRWPRNIRRRYSEEEALSPKIRILRKRAWIIQNIFKMLMTLKII